MVKIGSKIDEVRIDGRLESLRKDLDHYAAMGIEAVELPVHGLDAIRNGSLNERRMLEILDSIKNYRFEYSVHAPNPLNLMEYEEEALHIAVFRASLEFTRRIGARVLVYHSGRFFTEETFPVKEKQLITPSQQNSLLERERRHLLALSQAFPDITICMENARPYLFHSPYCYAERLELLKKQIERIDRPNVKVNLDVGHLHMAARFYEYDMLTAVEDIRSHVAHMHLHDNFGGTVYSHQKQQTHQIPFGKGDSHMPVGWGSVPIADILSIALPRYEGLLMMELRSRYFDSVEESKENLCSILSAIDSAQHRRIAGAPFY